MDTLVIVAELTLSVNLCIKADGTLGLFNADGSVEYTPEPFVSALPIPIPQKPTGS